MRFGLLLAVCASLACAQNEPPAISFEQLPAYVLSNGAVELTVLRMGATLGSIVLTGDGSKLNPLWNPAELARQAKQPSRFGNSRGHFVCVDGFGSVSSEEQAAGLPFHGEAYSRTFDTKSYKKQNGITTLTMSTDLPLMQEHFTRTIRMVDGEKVVYVTSKLESHLAFDRPIAWAEHATIGAPFLEPGVTVVDLPAVRSKTRPYQGSPSGTIHRFPSDKEFTWPMAPLLSGGTVDIRSAPRQLNTGDHTTSVLDRSRKYVFVTALHPGRKLLIGWVFQPSDFPWLQNWEFYPSNGMLARGLEFSTQPFDLPRREAVDMSPLFNTPTFRWLPAKSAIETTFAMFYTEVPEGFTAVSDLQVKNGSVSIHDANSGKRVNLDASILR